MTPSETSIYSQVGGFDTILALTRRWHELCLQDPEAAHPFEHGLHPQHDERLAAYLAEAFGGPKLYTAGYGDESSMQKIHSCNGVHIELDEACISQFNKAIKDVGITGSAAQQISAYFRHATEDQRRWASSEVAVPDCLPFNLA